MQLTLHKPARPLNGLPDEPPTTATCLGVLVGVVAGFGLGISAFAVLEATLGPLGTVLVLGSGLILGGLTGWLLERASLFHPSDEDAYWRASHHQQPYSHLGGYERFARAYRIGHLGRLLWPEQSFVQAEDRLRIEYERVREGDHPLPWQEGRQAALAAWERARRWQY
ncbi:hypothetical protein [Chitinimonas naiadis]